MGGRKSFSPGDILQAADVQDFLMDQTVMVFGGTAARGSGIASPTEGMISYRTDADALEVYTGTAWVPAAQAAGAATVTNRNLLYNGAMQVSQRGTSTTGLTGGGYATADRWWTYFAQATGTWTQTIENDAPTGSGFRRSLRMLCTTANSPIDAGDMLQVVQILEGQDLQRVAKGTASAKKLTMSFWVKSNVTGTYIVNLYDNDNTRQVSASYSVSASATWEKKTITFPADTTGAFDNDNAGSLFVAFVLAAGSTYTSGSLATTWAAYSAANQAVGQVNVAAATNNYWQITGVQLETGDVATDFEFKSYGQELRECQRYYEKSYDIATAVGTNTTSGAQQSYNMNDGNQVGGLRWIVPKRAAPTVRVWSKAGVLENLTDSGGNSVATGAPWLASDVGQFGFRIFVSATGGLTANRVYYYHYDAASEL